MERLSLARERIEQYETEGVHLSEEMSLFFEKEIHFATMVISEWDFVATGKLQTAPVIELRQRNEALFQDILPSHYDQSYANPTVAVEKLGTYGKYLCALAAELYSMIPAVYEQDEEMLVIRLELLIEIIGMFETAYEERVEPELKALKDILYWYVSDYCEDVQARRIKAQVNPEKNLFHTRLECDLSDERYLYTYGEYIGDNERKMAEFLSQIPQEQIEAMARTWTEGYRIGFEMTGKDLSKKKTAELRYMIGFERIAKAAVKNLAEIGLKPTMLRSPSSLMEGRTFQRNRVYGTSPNPQFDFDHKEDLALFLDKNLVQRRIECLQSAFEAEKEHANQHGGPAVLETFGEASFEPKDKEEAPKYDKAQQQDMVVYASKAGEITNTYIIGEERSFTIMALPVPSIGANFKEVFAETVKLNTLDYKLYQTIQQHLIDALDTAEYVIVKGQGANKTNMKVMLHHLEDPAHQSNFENCVADVNIPVGEVFTSPVLTGTEGVLHVTNVYLNGLQYKNLELHFEDGCVTTYGCTNFENPEQNQKLIKDTVLFHHDTLPIGEFAIGTNTTAFVAARRLQIEDKLPILIAEKTGPHFAVGDTCYSHEEEVKTYNPDGKELIAKENEKSALRHTDSSKAYFNCHTDITIPYDELAEISIVRADGSVERIIEEGRFVLPGTEQLNEAF